MLLSEVTAVGVAWAPAVTGTMSRAAQIAATTSPSFRTDMDPPGSIANFVSRPREMKVRALVVFDDRDNRRPPVRPASTGRSGERSGPPLLLLPPFVRADGLPGD